MAVSACPSSGFHFHCACSYHFVIAVCRAKEAQLYSVKRSWEIIADNLSKASWSWGCVSAVDSSGRTKSSSGVSSAIRSASNESVPSLRLPKRTELKYNRQLSEVLLKLLSITSPDVSTYLRPG